MRITSVVWVITYFLALLSALFVGGETEDILIVLSFVLYIVALVDTNKRKL